MTEDNNNDNQPFEPIPLYDEVEPPKPPSGIKEKEEKNKEGIKNNSVHVDFSIDHTYNCVIFEM